MYEHLLRTTIESKLPHPILTSNSKSSSSPGILLLFNTRDQKTFSNSHNTICQVSLVVNLGYGISMGEACSMSIKGKKPWFEALPQKI
jgi:hypothetical protein